MKPNHLFTSLLAATALLVASCSTSKMASNASHDDVYNTTAQAKEYKPAPPVQNQMSDQYATTDEVDEYYGKSDPYYDMDYSSRIDRFYYGSPYRNYYDPFYNYYGYNSFYSPYNNYYFGGGFGLGFQFNNWFNNPWNGWGFNYGWNPYNNFWGPYSWGGGFYGGGFYGGGWGGGGGRSGGGGASGGW